MKKTGIFLLILIMVLAHMTPMSALAADGIKVQSFNGSIASSTNTLGMNFKVVNTGSTALVLSTIKMRYYFTNDGTQANNFSCDYSTLGATNVTGVFGTAHAVNADKYLEIAFGSNAGTLAVGASAEVCGRVWKSDWSDFIQTNDYSFDTNTNGYVDRATVTAYISGVKVWGTEPGDSVITPTPTPTPSTPCKIMPLGDSITDGFNVAGGYRIKLLKNITSNDLKIDFVGSQSNGPAELIDRNHEGHSGWRIDQIDTNINSWMDTYTPEIVLLHIGTNDIIMNYDLANAPTRLSTLIDKICAKLPSGGKLYVAKITPLGDTSWNTKINTFNSKIPGIVQNKVNQGKPVYMIDMYSALTAADLADDIHPNSTGYNKMADVWFHAIHKDLN